MLQKDFNYFFARWRRTQPTTSASRRVRLPHYRLPAALCFPPAPCCFPMARSAALFSSVLLCLPAAAYLSCWPFAPCLFPVAKGKALFSPAGPTCPLPLIFPVGHLPLAFFCDKKQGPVSVPPGLLACCPLPSLLTSCPLPFSCSKRPGPVQLPRTCLLLLAFPVGRLPLAAFLQQGGRVLPAPMSKFYLQDRNAYILAVSSK